MNAIICGESTPIGYGGKIIAVQGEIFRDLPQQSPPARWIKGAEYRDQMTHRRVDTNRKNLERFQQGDRVVFRPHGVYPFSYGWGKKRSRHFPESNAVEGTVISTFACYREGEVDVKLDKGLAVTREGKRIIKDEVTVPIASIMDHTPQSKSRI